MRVIGGVVGVFWVGKSSGLFGKKRRNGRRGLRHRRDAGDIFQLKEILQFAPRGRSRRRLHGRDVRRSNRFLRRRHTSRQTRQSQKNKSAQVSFNTQRESARDYFARL